MYAEEKDLCRRIHDAGYTVHLVPSASSSTSRRARARARRSGARPSSGAASGSTCASTTRPRARSRSRRRRPRSDSRSLPSSASPARSPRACARARLEPGTGASSSRARRGRRSGHRTARACASWPTSTTRSSAGPRRDAPAAPGGVRRRARRNRAQAGRASTAQAQRIWIASPYVKLQATTAAAAWKAALVAPRGGRASFQLVVDGGADGQARRRAACEGRAARSCTRRSERAARAHGARDGALERRRARSPGRCPRSARAALGQAAQPPRPGQVFWVSIAGAARAARRRLPGQRAGRRPVGRATACASPT